MGRVEQYRAELRKLTEWEAYLKKNSDLPGARANLELVEAVGEEADPERLWRLSASSDEFLALCGTAGLGHLAISDPVPVMSWLRELVSDPRWRVREGVAIALQHLGRHSMPRLLAEMERWSLDGPYLQRAAAAQPEAGRPLTEKWLRSTDKDVAWVMQSNLGKPRMGALGPSWIAKWKGAAPKPAQADRAEVEKPAATAASNVLNKPAQMAKSS